MKRLFFIRHGLSELNVQGKLAGVTETPLTEKGKRQAKKAGKQAKKLNIDHIISSPLSRALETAKIFAKEIDYPISDIEINPMFIERNFGAKEATLYIPNTDYDKVEGAEKKIDLLKRSQRMLDYLYTLPHHNILVVSHGSIGRAIRHHLVQDEPFDYPVHFVNAQIVEWQIDN